MPYMKLKIPPACLAVTRLNASILRSEYLNWARYVTGVRLPGRMPASGGYASLAWIELVIKVAFLVQFVRGL